MIPALELVLLSFLVGILIFIGLEITNPSELTNYKDQSQTVQVSPSPTNAPTSPATVSPSTVPTASTIAQN